MKLTPTCRLRSAFAVEPDWDTPAVDAGEDRGVGRPSYCSLLEPRQHLGHQVERRGLYAGGQPGSAQSALASRAEVPRALAQENYFHADGSQVPSSSEHLVARAPSRGGATL